MDKKKVVKQALKKPVIPDKPKRDYYLILLWIMIAIVSIIRYRLADVPFERDEGEYGYIGNLFLHGVAPFKDAYSMKLPGTSFMYAILMVIFGHTSSGVHTGLVLIIAAAMYFFYAAFKKLFTPFIGLAASTIYGFMAIGFVFDGFAAHATHFICFFTSVALFFLADFMKSGKMLKIFLCGLMLGMAFIMKQQAVFLILFAGIFLLVYLIVQKKERILNIIKKTSFFSAGIFTPYLIVILIVLLTGEFKVFWLWTVRYASTYEGVKSWDIIVALFHSSFDGDWMIYNYFWLMALAGLLVLYWTPYTPMQKVFVVLFFIASACVVSAGFYFRAHYFIAILPATGLLGGIFIEFVMQQIQQRMKITKLQYAPVGILCVIVLYAMYDNRQYFFSLSPPVVCNMTYWGNPFNETPEIAKYIKANSSDTDKIGILGSEPEVCFYANRASATGYIYTYPLVENQPFNKIMQEQMIAEIEKSKPAYVVFCNIAYSWLPQPGVPQILFQWADKYINANYYPVGYADFYNDAKNRGWYMYWNDDIKNRIGQPVSSITVLRKKPENKI